MLEDFGAHWARIIILTTGLCRCSLWFGLSMAVTATTTTGYRFIAWNILLGRSFKFSQTAGTAKIIRNFVIACFVWRGVGIDSHATNWINCHKR